MQPPIVIDYYTDLLCVWAWIAQRRLEELHEQFGDKIIINHYYIDLFGDVKTRMEQQWGKKGGFEGFAEHVLHSVQPYDNASVNERLWTDVRPTTSANAHLIVKAIGLNYTETKATDFALTLRQAFFVEAQDISQFAVLMKLVKEQGMEEEKLRASIEDGSAFAALLSDYKQANQQNIAGSPSFVMNNKRQVLYGNVGYRVLHANVEELLRNPEQEASWC